MAYLALKFPAITDKKKYAVTLPTEVVNSSSHTITIDASLSVGWNYGATQSQGSATLKYQVNSSAFTTIISGTSTGTSSHKTVSGTKTVTGSAAGGDKLTFQVDTSIPSGASQITISAYIKIVVSNTTEISQYTNTQAPVLLASDLNRALKICGMSSSVVSSGTIITRALFADVLMRCAYIVADQNKPLLTQYNSMVTCINGASTATDHHIDRLWDSIT